MPPRPRPGHEAVAAAARAALGDEAFAATWDAGRALSAAQAVAEALADELESTAAVTGPLPVAGLDPREVEAPR